MTIEKHVRWTGELHKDAVALLDQGGSVVVCPTKVGYIIATADREGLERKFAAKNRKRNKPGVVLVGSLEQLDELAEMTPSMRKMYESCWQEDILLGCILPWKSSARKYIPKDGSEELMSDSRNTSCFVIKFGVPGEQLAAHRWKNGGGLLFASSANPSGKGNRGEVSGIGDQIEREADLIIEADDYVRSIQPDKTQETRYEQGVMISFVDSEGALVPEQMNQRSVSPAPKLIRKGLDVERIMFHLAENYSSWDYRHGEYY